ncbi:gliding motility protein GldB-related protein [Siphonobacter curvatus]|nr:gliding motility protein [Siphonobacter curvatus]
MRKILIISFLAGILGTFAACESSTESGQHTLKTLPGADTIQIHLAIERLDSSLFACSSKEEVKHWLDTHPGFVNNYFPKNEFQDRNQLVTELHRRVNEPSLREFYKQAQESFQNFQPLQADLRTAFRNMKAYDPKFRTPRVQLVFTGFMGPDLMVSDSVLVIGIDYFMGSKAKYRPDVYAYQLWRYTPQALVPQMLFIASEPYVKSDPKDRTLLAEMINYGKGYLFAQTMLPQTPDSLLIGYTGKQLAETEIAQDLVWGHFIDEKLLYETNPNKKIRYLGDRPQTPEIGPRCPGSIGRWLGWKIVRYYQDNNPDVSLKEFMTNTNARQILEASKYRGQTEQ